MICRDILSYHFRITSSLTCPCHTLKVALCLSGDSGEISMPIVAGVHGRLSFVPSGTLDSNLLHHHVDVEPPRRLTQPAHHVCVVGRAASAPVFS